MRVNYKGMDKNFNYRLAEISYDEYKEQRLMDRIETIMLIQGYHINQVTLGYATCEVEDKNDYKEFINVFKQVKKSVKLWERFGI